MEQWEKELREKLDKELEDGLYEIGAPDTLGYTGKLGYIDYRVAVMQALRKRPDNAELKFEGTPFKEIFAEATKEEYKEFTYKKFKEMFSSILDNASTHDKKRS